MSKILLTSRCAWSLVNYRSGQMRSLMGDGYEVVGAAAADGHEVRLSPLGVRFVELPIPYRSINPFADLRLFWHFYRMYRSERPEIAHHFTIKPVIYGSIAARLAGVPKIVNTVTGLGYVFSGHARPWLRTVVEVQYRAALACADYTLFQNEDDRHLFTQRRLVREDRAGFVPGSGVDLEWFAPRTQTDGSQEAAPVIFLMMGRLLRDKGVYEYVDAARLIKAEYPDTRFQLLGKRDEHNPSVVPVEDLRQWIGSGVIEYLGEWTTYAALYAPRT